MLASVTDEAEAEIALGQGADIIGIEDPSRQWPFPPDLRQVSIIANAVRGRRPLSAYAGEAGAFPEALRQAVPQLAASGVDQIKIALPADAHRLERVAALAPIAATAEFLAVCPAEQPLDLDLLPLLVEAGFRGVMLDTMRKGEKRLLELCDIAQLSRWVEGSRRAGLRIGFAGSLEAPDVPRLMAFHPDMLAFRSALCVGRDRRAALDPKRVSLMRDLVPRHNAKPQPGEDDRVDYRLLAGRAPAPDALERAVPADRIFVRDLVLPVSIGAYRSEHQLPQRVRFNVEAWITRATQAPADMRDILSYDVITDGIARIVGEGHVELVETLAWRIADLVLAEPKVMRVIVRVEKLDTGPGAVGVEITRDKPAEAVRRQSFPAVGNE
jgi:dihydroneopterin aldolase